MTTQTTITTNGLHWHTLTQTSASPATFEYVTGTPRLEGEYIDSATFSRKDWALSYAAVQQAQATRHGRVSRTDIAPCVSQCAIERGN